MTETVEIVHVHEPSAGLRSAVSGLTSQLSTSAHPMTDDALESMLRHDAINLFVARLDAQVVGMATLATFPTPTGTRAWIEDVVVSEDARGSGAGGLLVQAAVDRAGELGARTVDLTSRPSRAAANRLYLRLGFELRDTNVYRITC